MKQTLLSHVDARHPSLLCARPNFLRVGPARQPNRTLPGCSLGQSSARKSFVSEFSRKALEKEQVEVVTAAAEEDEDASPFFEPMLRSFALGIGAGVIVEIAHVLFKCAEAGANLPALLPEVEELLSPLLVWDNVAAIGSTLLFYILEAAAVLAVLQEYPDDKRSATTALQNTVTLPKRLMPVKLHNIKRLLYSFLSGRNPIATSLLGFVDDSAGRPSLPGPKPSSGVGTAVLERPQAPAPQPLPRALPPTSPPPSSRPTSTPVKPAPRPAPAPSPVPAARRSLPPGALDPATSDLLQGGRRAKELRDRQSYLKNFWYAAALSQNLKPGELLEVKILGRTVVLFRDEATGKPRCLDNICPHRGAPLGKGWLKQVPAASQAPAGGSSCSSGTGEKSHGKGHAHKGGDTCVVCPYHGWAFDAKGKLREVPSQDDSSKLPRRPLVDSYPLEERGGFIWLFFGSSSMPAAERPPIPFTPELEDPQWQPVYGEIEFECGHWGVFDNAIDMAHIHYLHGDSFGNKDKPIIHDMKVERDTFGILGSFRIHNKPVNAMWEWTATESVPVQANAYLPSTSSIKIQLGAGVSMITFVNTVPISANRAVNRFCLIRNFAGWDGFDVWARNAMFKILGEDKVMVEKLRPEAMRQEVSLNADLPQIAFRKLRQEWIDMGYGVAPETTEGYTGSLDM